MGVCILSSVLAFAAGFLFSIFCLIKCSKDKWERFRNAVEEARKGDRK